MQQHDRNPATGESESAFFRSQGGYRLTAVSAVGLALLVAGNFIGGVAPWPSLILILGGVLASIYCGMNAWALTAPVEDSAGTSGGEVTTSNSSAAAVGLGPESGRERARQTIRSAARPGAFSILKAMTIGGSGEGARQVSVAPLAARSQNALFLKVALGSWLFSGIGCLLLLIAVFRVA